MQKLTRNIAVVASQPKPTSRGGSALVNRPCEYRVGGCPVVVVLISNNCSLHTDLFSIFAMAKVVDEGQEIQIE